LTFTSAPQRALATELRNRGGIFRENVRDLPRTPDIVFDKEKLIVFFHGCFWHGHDCREWNLDAVWLSRVAGTRLKDKKANRELRAQGYEVIVVWECEFSKKNERAIQRILDRLQLRSFILPPPPL
jgi:DNA mismatch endonuclease (patch repair protein)